MFESDEFNQAHLSGTQKAEQFCADTSQIKQSSTMSGLLFAYVACSGHMILPIIQKDVWMANLAQGVGVVFAK